MLKNLLVVLSILSLSLSITSCNDCIGLFGREKIVCDNGGTCNEGECDCLKGYSGTTCDVLDLCELNDVICVYGSCEDGDCFCEEGYEGDDCSVESRARFVGKYNMTYEGCAPLDTFYNHEITIERNQLNGEGILIRNVFNAARFSIAGFFSPVEANVAEGGESFTIFPQNPDDNSKSITGSGTLDYSDSTKVELNVDYTVINGNKTYTCQLTCEKIL